MNWDANLAAIIKHTDANLKQQFRQFENLPMPSGAFSPPPVLSASAPPHAYQREPQEETGNSIGSTFLRETMATMRGEAPSASFAQHFRDLRDRRKHEQRENNRAPSEDGESEYDATADQQEHRSSSRRRRSRHPSGNTGLGHHMYSSPTYDMAQMMEQVRLSLKLEVDARAAIAERQLSALMQLCKASSEELDRLRIEVCATDRQLHTLDQVQSKMRQELTTQKDISFHLQSMCGKDESWRIQAENQLLELRQMVAALREHGNVIQMQVQEKLSRQELLVQFNAAIEPIKAQFQATLQHQAQQLAEVTRTSSSTSLLLDTLTQKVNRVQSDELIAVRADLQALKAHVSRMGMLDGRSALDSEDDSDPTQGEYDTSTSRSRSRRSGHKRASRVKERAEADKAQRDELLKKEIVEKLLPQAVREEVEVSVRPRLAKMKELALQHQRPIKDDVENALRQQQESSLTQHRQTTATVAALEAQLKQLDQQLRGELLTHSRELRDKLEQHGNGVTTQLTALSETHVSAIQAKCLELSKAVDTEQIERKAAIDRVNEDVRKVRHAFEEQIHATKCEHRSTTSAMSEEWTQRLRETQRKCTDAVESASDKHRLLIDTGMAKVDGRVDRVEAEIKTLHAMTAKMERTVAQSQASVAQTAARVKGLESIGDEAEAPSRPVRRGSASAGASADVAHSAQLASIDMLLQKMMLQMQCQHQQQQSQLAMAVTTASPTAPQPAPPQTIPGQVMPVGQDHKTADPQVIKDEPAKPPLKEEVPATTPVKPVPGPEIDDIVSRAVADGLAATTNTTQRPPPAPSTSSAPRTPPTSAPLTTVPPPPSTDSKVSKNEAPTVPVIQIPDSNVRVQQTLEASAKGAITEAEMAVLRIEARRKQEQEARQQSTTTSTASHKPVAAAPLPSLTRAASTTSVTSPPATPGPAITTPLVRSTSVSNLTVPPPPSQSPASSRPQTSHSSNASMATPTKPPPPPPTPPTMKPPPAPEVKAANAPPPVTINVPAPTTSSPEAKPPSTTPPSPPAVSPAPSPPTAVATGTTPSHTLCEQCRLPVRSELLAEHMQRQCIKRTVGCAKCQVKFSWHEVDSHQRDCTSGSSTTASPPPPSVPAPALASDVSSSSALKKCRHCSADVPGSELFEHELRCDQMLKQCPHCLRRQRVAELQDHIENCDCRLVSCPNDCGGKFLQRAIEKHVTTRCSKRSASSTPTTAAEATTPAPTSGTTTVSLPLGAAPAVQSLPGSEKPRQVDKVECKFCDEAFSSRDIDVHENNCDWKPKRCQHCNMVIIARDLLRHEASCKTTTKKCPHCNDTMPQSALALHTSRCAKRPIKCIRCCQMFPADAIVAHSSSCKFVPTASAPALSVAGPSASVNRVPPPPPTPPPSSATTQAASKPPTPGTLHATKPSVHTTEDEERIARRNLALSQLTNQRVGGRPPALNPVPSTNTQGNGVAKKQEQEDDHNIDDSEEDEEDEEDEDDEEEEEEGDHLTLAQVVAEWSVENVCLWLHEDVGVPEVVPRFQQRRCNGELLLELTESDLINDYGIKNRVHRERILSAIDAIKTSDDLSDEDLDEGDEDDEEEEEEEEHHHPPASRASAMLLQTPHQRATPMSRLVLSDAAPVPQTLLRRNSLPSPQQSPIRTPASTANTPLPSSNSMLRRINSALNVEFPPSSTTRK